MVRTLIEPQVHALQPPVAGDFAGTPLAELLFAHAAAGSSGTLRISDEAGTVIAALRLEAGALVGASTDSPGSGLLASAIPLCARAHGRFTFAHGPDDLGVGPHVVRGTVDVLALIAASMRGPVREDAIDAVLQDLGAAPLWRNPRVDVERYGFGPQELALVRMIDGATASAPELLTDPPCAPHVARRVLYTLAITRALTAPPRAQRQVSGTVARQTPAPPPLPSRAQSLPPLPPLTSRRVSVPPRTSDPTVVVPRRDGSAPTTPLRKPASRAASGEASKSAPPRQPAGRYHVQGGAPERVAGAEPRAGAPRRSLPSALAWRDDLRERARLAPRQSAYEVLGVLRECETTELHEAHTAIATRFASDALPDAGEDASRDAAVVLEHARRALELLSDPVTRGEYDRACAGVGGGNPPERVLRSLHAEACYRRAEALWKRRDYAAAQHAVERALSLHAASARYEALLGLLLHLRSGSSDGGSNRVHPAALRHLETALKLDPRCEQANYAMALVLKRAGRDDEAFQHFQRVWKQNPANLEAAREVRLHVMRTRKRSTSGRLVDRLLGRSGKPPKRD